MAKERAARLLRQAYADFATVCPACTCKELHARRLSLIQSRQTLAASDRRPFLVDKRRMAYSTQPSISPYLATDIFEEHTSEYGSREHVAADSTDLAEAARSRLIQSILNQPYETANETRRKTLASGQSISPDEIFERTAMQRLELGDLHGFLNWFEHAPPFADTVPGPDDPAELVTIALMRDSITVRKHTRAAKFLAAAQRFVTAATSERKPTEQAATLSRALVIAFGTLAARKGFVTTTGHLVLDWCSRQRATPELAQLPVDMVHEAQLTVAQSDASLRRQTDEFLHKAVNLYLRRRSSAGFEEGLETLHRARKVPDFSPKGLPNITFGTYSHMLLVLKDQNAIAQCRSLMLLDHPQEASDSARQARIATRAKHDEWSARRQAETATELASALASHSASRACKALAACLHFAVKTIPASRVAAVHQLVDQLRKTKGNEAAEEALKPLVRDLRAAQHLRKLDLHWAGLMYHYIQSNQPELALLLFERKFVPGDLPQGTLNQLLDPVRPQAEAAASSLSLFFDPSTKIFASRQTMTVLSQAMLMLTDSLSDLREAYAAFLVTSYGVGGSPASTMPVSKPTAPSYLVYLRHFARLSAQPEELLGILDDMRQHQTQPTTEIFNVLVGYFAREGDSHSVSLILHAMELAEAKILRLGKPVEALRLPEAIEFNYTRRLQSLLSDGYFVPAVDDATYTTILRGLAGAANTVWFPAWRLEAAKLVIARLQVRQPDQVSRDPPRSGRDFTASRLAHAMKLTAYMAKRLERRNNPSMRSTFALQDGTALSARERTDKTPLCYQAKTSTRAIAMASRSLVFVLCALSTALPAVVAHAHAANGLPRLAARSAEQVEKIERLFRRQSAAGTPSTIVGLQSDYPPMDVFGPAPQQAWIDAYNVAKAAGLIPDIPPTTNNQGTITYPASVANPQSDVICSWTQNKCFAHDDIHNAPDGMVGISFDDGPQLPSPTLYNFLSQQGQKATHFYIGSRIIENPTIFTQALNNGDEIAVHTWAHPALTSMTDMQLLGEFGWCMQAIYDMSGKIPRLSRPPYGDIDNRVRAIANQVFGLTNVIWNQDTLDWTLTDASAPGTATPGRGPQTDAGLVGELSGFYAGAKSPGLIILEHELSTRTVAGFINTYPQLKAAGWDPRSISDLFGTPWYQNANNDEDVAMSMPIAVGGNHLAYNATTSVAAPSTTSSSSVSTTSAPSTTMAAPLTTSINSAASAAAESSAVAVAAGGSLSHSDTSTTKKSAMSLSTGAIIGIAIGGAVLFILLCSCCWFCCCHTRKPTQARYREAWQPTQEISQLPVNTAPYRARAQNPRTQQHVTRGAYVPAATGRPSREMAPSRSPQKPSRTRATGDLGVSHPSRAYEASTDDYPAQPLYPSYHYQYDPRGSYTSDTDLSFQADSRDASTHDLLSTSRYHRRNNS
ncbi:carbohydrate esterase family 4 protein [Mixia osmundae IAM 14324]|uniref:chitin deacetylase n=1 Tax=Mixia osmundae (strain CBS 9802 / IAM 14324 / JCM 22182 / KY 12970) TaxID=764103 RepID=G7EAH6_MIXOS|nr:carbohydrate esterase family 4 protein [Mixia osmundae IAM 14324]KEI42326.1 carbohydrate esterase family 4 protein [Mixia osmundae IAM 14324]GAA99836.1 hypothetical protein E5Q_06539 [Mixia osmundae IAM 14324]